MFVLRESAHEVYSEIGGISNINGQSWGRTQDALGKNTLVVYSRATSRVGAAQIH